MESLERREQILDIYSDIVGDLTREFWIEQEGLWAHEGYLESVLSFISTCNDRFEGLNIKASYCIKRTVAFHSRGLWVISFAIYSNHEVDSIIRLSSSVEDVSEIIGFLRQMYSILPFRVCTTIIEGLS